MRNDKEFLSEIYSREEKYKRKIKKTRIALVCSLVPLLLCTVFLATSSMLPLITKSKSADDVKYTGNTEDIADEVTDDIVKEEIETTDDELVADSSSSSQIHYPNQEQDGDYSDSRGGAPLKDEITQDSATSKNSQTTNKFDTSGNAINESSFEAPEWFKEYQERWKSVIDAENFTLIYDSKEICVSNETAVDKMVTLIADPYHKVADFVDNSPEILTIEMGGMKFVLKSKTLQNVTLDESYFHSELFIKAFKYVLEENNVLTGDLTRELDEIIDSFATSTLTSEEAENTTDGYTLTYGCIATRVSDKESTEKMRAFLQETCKYWCLVDWVKKPETICTIELDGNQYSLVDYYIVENLAEGGGAYILNRNELEAFRNILGKSNALAESVDLAINEVLETIDEVEPLSSTPRDDD